MDFANTNLSHLSETVQNRTHSGIQVKDIDPTKKRYAKKLPVLITGGIGDNVIGCSIVKKIEAFIGEEVDVYTKYPEVVLLYLGRTSKLLKEVDCFDMNLILNSVVAFILNPHFKGFKNQKIADLFLRWKQWDKGDWHQYIFKHAFLDNQMAKAAIELKLDRVSLPFAMLGLNGDLEGPVVPRLLRKKWAGQVFITLNDGIEKAYTEFTHRTTKNWNLMYWDDLCEQIKWEFPHIEIIQLGTKETKKINGATIDLRGKTSLNETTAILSCSLLHIDSDSGIAWIAKSLNRRTITLYGPTPVDFFGYSGTGLTNLHCRDCFWLKTDWLVNCPVGYSRPVCMDNIEPQMVMQIVRRELQ